MGCGEPGCLLSAGTPLTSIIEHCFSMITLIVDDIETGCGSHKKVRCLGGDHVDANKKTNIDTWNKCNLKTKFLILCKFFPLYIEMSNKKASPISND